METTPRCSPERGSGPSVLTWPNTMLCAPLQATDFGSRVRLAHQVTGSL